MPRPYAATLCGSSVPITQSIAVRCGPRQWICGVPLIDCGPLPERTQPARARSTLESVAVAGDGAANHGCPPAPPVVRSGHGRHGSHARIEGDPARRPGALLRRRPAADGGRRGGVHAPRSVTFDLTPAVERLLEEERHGPFAELIAPEVFESDVEFHTPVCRTIGEVEPRCGGCVPMRSTWRRGRGSVLGSCRYAPLRHLRASGA